MQVMAGQLTDKDGVLRFPPDQWQGERGLPSATLQAQSRGHATRKDSRARLYPHGRCFWYFDHSHSSSRWGRSCHLRNNRHGCNGWGGTGAAMTAVTMIFEITRRSSRRDKMKSTGYARFAVAALAGASYFLGIGLAHAKTGLSAHDGIYALHIVTQHGSCHKSYTTK
jgi:hypothetical protein